MRWDDWLQERRVAFGWAFGLAYLAFARPRPGLIAAGSVLLVAGAAVRTWASGHIRKREVLATTGPYAHTRNPLYFGSFLMACGALLMGGNAWLAACSLLFAVPVYGAVLRQEEALLTEKFGAEFREYRRTVPGLFPRLRVPPESRGSFDWGLVRSHREWRGWLAALGLPLFLLARWFWGR